MGAIQKHYWHLCVCERCQDKVRLTGHMLRSHACFPRKSGAQTHRYYRTNCMEQENCPLDVGPSSNRAVEVHQVAHASHCRAKHGRKIYTSPLCNFQLASARVLSLRATQEARSGMRFAGFVYFNAAHSPLSSPCAAQCGNQDPGCELLNHSVLWLSCD